MMENRNGASADVIDLADIIRSIRNGRFIVLGWTLAGILAALAVILFAAPKFAGRASLVLRTENNSGPGSSMAAAISAMSDVGAAVSGGGLSQLKTTTETEVDILQSRSMAGLLVDSLRLQAFVRAPRSVAPAHVFTAVRLPGSFRKVSYTFTRNATDQSSFAYRANGDSGVAHVGQPAKLAIGEVSVAPTATAAEYTVDFLDREDAITMVTEHLDFDKLKTDVAHFEYRASDSVTAAAVPNLLLSLYMERRKGIDRGVNQRRAEFLAAQVDSVNAALTASERALRAEQEATGVLDPAASTRIELETESRLRQQLTDIQVQEAALQQLVSQIREGKASPRQLAAYPQYLSSGPINGMVGNLVAIETERQGLLMTRTEEDQDVKALGERAKNIEGQLLPLAQTTLTALGIQRQSVQDKLSKMQATLLGMPRSSEAYTRLEREILDRGRIYAGLQSQLVDARLAAIGEGGDVRPLDLASIPKKPVYPRKGLMLAGGLGGGLFAGLIFAVLLGVVGGRMHDAQDVERRTGLPAVRYERTAPLLVAAQASRSVIVAPINERALATPVAERLVETAMSRSLSATILDLSSASAASAPRVNAPNMLVTAGSNGHVDVNGAIRRLEETHDLVVVQLPNLSSHEAAAALSETRPVLLVAPERRIERRSLQGAIDLLRRVGAPCAGVVLHGDDRRTLRA
jgi:tyrosine-protein kinase Etk/Wzc